MVAVDNWRRVKCPECLDSGYRRCVHPRSVEDAVHGRLGFLYDCAVACPCEAGERKFPDQVRGESIRRYPRYSPSRWCLAESVRHADNVSALESWIVTASEASDAAHFAEVAKYFDERQVS